MVKFIDYWMFTSHLWHDADPTPVAINIREITRIEQIRVPKHGDVVAIYLKNDDSPTLIEGDIIEVLAEFQKHLINQY